MTIDIKKVLPGDLIRADWHNAIVDELVKLDARLSLVEKAAPGGGPPSIEYLNPAGTLTEGDELRILGHNLGMSSLVSVTVEEVPVQHYGAGSTDKVLIVTIPSVPGLAEGGEDVDLEVTNQKGTTSTTFRLQPCVVGTLATDFSFQVTAPTQAIVPPATADYVFDVSGYASQREDYHVIAIIDPQSWTATVDQTQVTIPRSQDTPYVLPPLTVTVTIPAGATQDGTLRLELRAQNYSGVSDSSPLVTVALGEAPTPSNPAVTLAEPTAIPTTRYVNGTFYVSDGGHIDIDVIATATTPDDVDDYVTTATVIAQPGSGASEEELALWTVQVTSPNPLHIVSDPRSILLTLSAQAGAAAAARLRIEATRGTEGPTYAEYSIVKGSPPA
ncbi:MAG: hypothetical protein JW940_32690 [Polyangiaceae bacterium]|nr:hypothetical protein [Polyangiaceae bacterium]